MLYKNVKRIKLGSQGLEVPCLGLGCMGMSYAYGLPKPEPQMIKLLHNAIDSGVHSPSIRLTCPIALKGVKREDVQVATKFGQKFGESYGELEVHGEPEYVRACCEASLKRLGVDYIDLYYAHRIDTKVPIEITMGELKKLVEEGKIKYIGLSEAGPETIRRAHAVHPITAVQLEWSLWTRDAEDEVIPTCRIGIVPFGPLGSGFFASGPKCVINVFTITELGNFMHGLSGSSWTGSLAYIIPMYNLISEMGEKKGCTPITIGIGLGPTPRDDVRSYPGTKPNPNLNENLDPLELNSRSRYAELESVGFNI
ncbi:auxin-induced protein PCNT115-like protein [Tanacetum coccineum]